MPRFEYIALDARGTENRGVLEANTQNDVVNQLRQSGYFPTSVVVEGQGGAKVAKKGKTAAPAAKVGAPAAKKDKTSALLKKSVPSKTLMIFTRQLATLIDAGLPLLKGLGVLAKQEKNLTLKAAINSMADGVQGGSVLAQPFAERPMVADQALDHGPIGRAVIGVDQMGDLVGGQIVDHCGRGHDHAPAVADRAIVRTA